MKKDNMYRYCIQFTGKTGAEKRAGEFLEMLGRRKSSVIITALNEYLDRNPDAMSSGTQSHIKVSSVDMTQLESRIRQMIEERLAGIDLGVASSQREKESVQEVSQDIMDMLGDLELFHI